jgi:hypothetical protein
MAAMNNHLTDTAALDPETVSRAKEWALKRLAGVAENCVRSIQGVTINQVVSAEYLALAYEASPGEIIATIHAALLPLTNCDPVKLAALLERYPK